MSTMREALFDVLVNATVQIALFALLAAALSSFVAKAKAKHQHLFYLGVLALCLSVPVMNTFRGARRAEVAQSASRDAVHDDQARDAASGYGREAERRRDGSSRARESRVRFLRYGEL